MIGNHLNPAAPLGDSLAAEMAEQADYLEHTGPLQALAGRTAATPGQVRGGTPDRRHPGTGERGDTGPPPPRDR